MTPVAHPPHFHSSHPSYLWVDHPSSHFWASRAFPSTNGYRESSQKQRLKQSNQNTRCLVSTFVFRFWVFPEKLLAEDINKCLPSSLLNFFSAWVWVFSFHSTVWKTHSPHPTPTLTTRWPLSWRSRSQGTGPHKPDTCLQQDPRGASPSKKVVWRSWKMEFSSEGDWGPGFLETLLMGDDWACLWRGWKWASGTLVRSHSQSQNSRF